MASEGGIKDELGKRPLAFEILQLMRESRGSTTLTALAQELNRSPPTIHELLTFLERNDLIHGEKKGRQKLYSLVDREAVQRLSNDPELKDKLSESFYRLQGQSVYQMKDLALRLAKEIKAEGLRFQSDVAVQTLLGKRGLDFLVNLESGTKVAVELKRVRHSKQVPEELATKLGELTAVLGSGAGIEGYLLVLLLPRAKVESDFDEWRYRELFRSAGGEKARVELVLEHVDDHDLTNPSFTRWLAKEISDKVKSL